MLSGLDKLMRNVLRGLREVHIKRKQSFTQCAKQASKHRFEVRLMETFRKRIKATAENDETFAMEQFYAGLVYRLIQSMVST